MAKSKEPVDNCHDPAVIKQFEQYITAVAAKRIENKKNGIKWTQDNATKVYNECYREIYDT